MLAEAPSPTPELLGALILRVAEWDGPDPELDADVVTALTGGEIEWKVANYTGTAYPVIKRPSTMHVQGFSREPVPPVTSMIDAAIGLVIQAMPEANCYGVEYDPRNKWEAHVSRNFVHDGHWLKTGEHRTSGGAAVILALLKAKIYLMEAARAPAA